MAVELTRRVDFPMVDMAGIVYYPRIYDLAHRFFEESWEVICGISYPEIMLEMKLGFPIVDVKSVFHSPIKYGDEVKAKISISHVGNTSCKWEYEFYNQNNVLLWSSEQVTVCVDLENMDSVSIPKVLKDGLEAQR